jgi:cellulose synthase/poly-beta-1,6-N-acetylglucosamine synthase-like glycosyltransferase
MAREQALRPLLEVICLILFLFLTLTPGIYGIHLFVLMFLAHRRGDRIRVRQHEVIDRYNRDTAPEAWPRVTTQLPLYNEFAVARRVIEAACRMDYPAGRHEVQVLDDSTDETQGLVDRVCAELRAQGYDVKAVRRPNRESYKAGALAYGLTQASGEFIAVFDADFVPEPGFLRRLVPLIATQPDAGCAQGRWGHLNQNESWLTKALALGIDGHFGVEQGARGWNGLLLNFNGTGGIWRKATIDDPQVGGWQGDTLTEDLDLSYRAQMAGWKVVYCMDVVSPAEVPGDVDAIKTQQRRWATGSIQTARKLLPMVWRAKLSLLQKIEATIHLTQYSVALFMVLIPLFAWPLRSFIPLHDQQAWFGRVWWLLLLAMCGPSLAYVYARWHIGGGFGGLKQVVRLIVLGLGLSVNNCAAVIVGLVQRGGEFIRTPKSGNQGQPASSQSYYKAIRSRLWILELLLGAYCLAQWLVFLRSDGYIGGTYLLLYAIGLFSFGWASRPHPPSDPHVAAGTGTPDEAVLGAQT